MYAIPFKMNKNKPEHMTCLTGEVFVPKNHPRIIFRGAIDRYIAEVLLVTADTLHTEYTNTLYRRHLEEIVSFVRQIQTAEASSQPFGALLLLGLTAEELREHSHHPKQYVGMNHIFNLSPDHDIIALRVNRLRAMSRELEIKGITAYTDDSLSMAENGAESVIQALNRLSSALYIMELNAVSGRYRR